MKKIYSIQILRALAAIGVLLYHCLIIEKKYSGGDLILPGFLKIGQAGVDLFFVISGFIMVTITQNKQSKLSNIAFLLHRLIRIYPVYWFYLALALLTYVIHPEFVNSSQGNRFGLLTSIFLFPSYDLPIIPVAWSLSYEVYFYMIFSFILRFSTPKMVRFLLSWLAVLLGIHYLIGTTTNPILHLITAGYSIEFIFGALAAIYIRTNIPAKVHTNFYYVLILLILILILIGFPFFYSPDGKNVFPQSIILGICFSMLVISMVQIESSTKRSFQNILSKIGDASYSMYLSHVLILSALGRIWALYFQNETSGFDNFLVLLLMIIIVIMCSLFAFKYIEYPLYRSGRKLVDKRLKTSA